MKWGARKRLGHNDRFNGSLENFGQLGIPWKKRCGWNPRIRRRTISSFIIQYTPFRVFRVFRGFIKKWPVGRGMAGGGDLHTEDP